MTTLTLGGQVYTLSKKLDTFSQLHIARKLAPALPVVHSLVNPGNAGKDKSVLTVLMLSHIPDEDTEFVIRKCMSVVTRQQGSTPAKVMAPDGTLMFDDLSMETLLEITSAVIDDNLGDFFRTALVSSNPLATVAG